MKKLYYPAVFHPEETGYSVIIPDIEGCFTQGETIEEAYAYAADIIGLCLEEYKVQNRPVPSPSEPKALAVEDGDFLVLIAFDELAYRKHNDTRSVKKTLSIPSWLNIMAEEQNINFSQTLQNALKEQLHIQG